MPKPKFKHTELNRKINWNAKNIEGIKRKKLKILRAELGADYDCSMMDNSCSCCQTLMKMAERYVNGFQVANRGGRKPDSSYLNDRRIYQECNFYEKIKHEFDEEWQKAFLAGQVKGKKPLKVVARELGMSVDAVKAALDRYRNQMKNPEQIFNPRREDYKNLYLRDTH